MTGRHGVCDSMEYYDMPNDVGASRLNRDAAGHGSNEVCDKFRAT